MSKKELVAYNDWFHGIMPERIRALSRIADVGTGTALDGSVASLEPLGRWFENQVEAQPPTNDELSVLRPEFRQAAGPALTTRTLSLSMDIGMYFGKVALQNVPGTRWIQSLRNTKDAEYGQPVIVGHGRIPLNPVHVIVMTAYGIARAKPAALGPLYDT